MKRAGKTGRCPFAQRRQGSYSEPVTLIASVLLLVQAAAPASDSRPASAPTRLFDLVPNAFGGPSAKIKCEGVDVADLDLDGKLDVIFATGFVLRPKKQEPAAPQIQMNRGTQTEWKFVDEAEARLPKGFVVQAGGVIARDLNADGAPDLLFAQMEGNAGGRPAAYLRNDGKGIFNDLTGVEFPATPMSSAGGEAGDVDDDGDLDVILCDQGKSPRLFLNDGTGKFTDATDRLPAITMPVAQDVTFADIDGDFDLDLVGTFKGTTGQLLFLNDGTGKFTDATEMLGYKGSANNYECEWGDLDDDGDVDGFWISMEGYIEGTSKNLHSESGQLGFEHSKATIIGHNDDDDNEVSYADVDQDGRLDVIIATLAYMAPKLYLNRGGFRFEYVDAFEAKRAPGCDGIAVDLNGDGRIDYVHCIGESGTGNLLFAGRGPADSRGPKIIATRMTQFQDTWTVHAFIQDSVYDDGQDYLQCTLAARSKDDSGGVRTLCAMTPMGGHLFRAAWNANGVPIAPSELVVVAKDAAGNITSSAPTPAPPR